MRSQLWAPIRTAIFTIFVPGTVALYVPYRLTRGAIAALPFDWVGHLAVVPLIFGITLYLHSAWQFAVVGLGTPAPINPPKRLVVRGAYRWTRNPLYVAVLSVLAGQAIMIHSAALAEYAVAVFVGFYAFVLLYEEPVLRSKFGPSYAEYCAHVPRWIGFAVAFLVLPAGAATAAEWQDSSRHRVQFVTVEAGVRLEVLDWGGSGRGLAPLADLPGAKHQLFVTREADVLRDVRAFVARLQDTATRKAPLPVEPIPGIFDAFRTHDVVGLSAGESHGDERGPAFVVSLIRDPRFAPTLIDVVMENASARYQDVMDKYVRGDDVPFGDLRRVWEETTQPQVVGPVGEIPAIYRALRDVNLTQPRERGHRALLGDPPIEWEHVQNNADFRKWLELRDSHAADVIRREAIAKKRRALVVYGGGHLQRKQQATNYRMDHPLAQTVISLLERAGLRTFVVTTVAERAVVRSWPVPSLALIAGTTLGAEEVPQGSLPRVSIQNGKFVPIPREQWIALRMEEQIDALLYLGPASKRRIAPLSPTICSEPGYLETHLRRMALSGVPPAEAERLKQFCAK